jgi:integrase
MARTPTVWRRSGEKGAWYTTVRGRKIRLAPATATKRQATEMLGKVLAREAAQGNRAGPVPADPAVRDCVNLYLADRLEAARVGAIAESTASDYHYCLAPFASDMGHLRAAELSPAAAEAWVRARAEGAANASGLAWGESRRAKAAHLIASCFRFCVRSGVLARSPVEGMRRPRQATRQAIPTGAAVERLLIEATPRFRDFLLALRLTGCRPGEAAGVTAADVDLEAGTWSVVNKTRGKTGRPRRTVYLSPAALDLTRRLVAKHPDGAILRNERGQPWTPKAWGRQFRVLRKRVGLGPETVAYGLRHLYCTDLAENGVPLQTAAELMGHTDTKMIMSVYSKLRTRTEHLREAAGKAAG